MTLIGEDDRKPYQLVTGLPLILAKYGAWLFTSPQVMEQTTSLSVCKSKQAHDRTIESEENVISKPEKLIPEELQIRLKFSKDKDHNGDVVCNIPTSVRSLTVLNSPAKAWSDIEEGEIIEIPDAYAESKRQCSDRFPPKENVADHKTISQDLRKRKHEDDATCRLCGKNFPSMRSLYGHMRCHKRNWRGLSPPPEENTPEPITPIQKFSQPATDFNSSNQVLPPLNTSMMAKSGRKGKAATDPKNEELGDPSIDAANSLLLLANVTSLGSTSIGQQQNRTSLSYDSRTMNNEDGLKINTQLDSMNENSTSMNADKTECSNQNISKLVIGYNKTVGTSSCQPAINEPTKKINDLEMVTNLVSDRKQYLCSICSKSFFSYQALGCHTTIHKQKKSNVRVEILEVMKEAKGVHRCNICGQTFPTGQALGGHKRKHWPRPENSVAPSSESAKKASHPHLDIDLNKPPQDLD